MASYLRWAHGESQGAKRFSLQAQRVARGATDSAQILGMAEAAKCLALLERELSQADAMAMEARALAQRLAYRCPAIPLALGILRYYEYKFDDAIECLEDARALSKSDGDKFSEFLANEYLAMVEMERGDYATAVQYAGNLVAIGERMRDGSERPFSHALQALCNAIRSGEEEECVLEPALHELRAADAKQRLAFLLNRAAIQYLQRGDLQKANACASEALQLAHIMERPSELLQAYITLEHVHRRNRDLAPDSVRNHIEQLAAAGVAGWVKDRANALLREPI
jgi:tetratricopeptide (TPR) repeat protein